MLDYRKENESRINNKIELMLKEVPQFIASYILSLNATASASTRLEYLRDIKRFLIYIMESYTEECIEDIRDIDTAVLESLDTDFLNSYILYLKTYKENGEIRTNSDISIRRKLSSVRNLYAFLYLNDKISSNPMVKINSPRPKSKPIIRMEDDETSDFLNAVIKGGSEKMQAAYHEKQKIRDYTLISLLLGTGMRVSECVGLNIDDVDLKHFAINIVRKGGKQEIIYISDNLAGILEEYIEYRKSLTPLPSHENALFLSAQRKRIGVRTIEVLVKKYKEQASLLKNITPHKLRSTFGTNLYEATGDLYLVAEVLGHSSVETTKSHYANISDKHKFENRNKV